MIRNRFAIADLSVILATIVVLGFLAFEVDVFVTQGSVSRTEQTIELDEALALGAFLSVGLLFFVWRRHREQKQEMLRRIAAEQHARELAFQDPLTGLANRRQFSEALGAVVTALPRAGASHALFMLDLNGFKQVNDIYGHGVGDELLLAIAQRLMSAVREGDLVARLGGDEFAIISQHLMSSEAATNIALRILAVLEEPIRIGSNAHRVGAGIGIALIPNDATVAQEALRKADVALYRAKAERRSVSRFFEPEMDKHVQEREQINRDLREAITTKQLIPFFQPVVDLDSRSVIGFEAIPRWHDAKGKQIPLERFIPIAEENGLIHDLFLSMLSQCCLAARDWPSEVTFALDVYPTQLKDQNLSEKILSVLKDWEMAPGRLELEITESALVHDLEAAQQLCGSLRAAGVRISLDNFGTGYSSLYHLRNFKLDKIKIDRSFIEGIGSHGESAGIVNALIGLAHGLGITVMAEGVTDAEQRSSLLTNGCQQAQGGLFSTAVSADEAARLFSS